MKDLIADLGSSDIVKREDAMRILSADQSLTLTQLEALLKDPDLSAEQRCRISHAAKQRFMNAPKPAMGVRFDSRLPDRVAIDTVYKDFPAATLLEPGDIIVSCMGEKLHSRGAWVQLGAHIFSREPGDVVSIVVRRGANKLTLDVPLGSYADLNGVNVMPGNPANVVRNPAPDEERLERAWDMRSKRRLAEARPAIDPKLPAEEWKPEPTQVQARKLSRYKGQAAVASRPRTIVAGGEPRGGEIDYEELLVLAQQPGPGNPVNRGWAQQQLAMQGMGGMGVGAFTNFSGIVQTTQQELSGLETRRVQIERQLEDLKLVKPEQLVQIEQKFQAQRDELVRVKRQIDAIRAEAAEEGVAEVTNRRSTSSPDR